MDYSKVISQCIDFIEENIKLDLTPKILAKECGYSTYHFCRLFSLNKGISLMEYVKKRRLSLAKIDLFNGSKIIDIAIEYGYDTHSGFSKAFKNEYGFTPMQYVKRMEGYIGENLIVRIGGYIMEPVIIKKLAFKVAGYGINTNVTDGNYTKDVASFWSNYDGENLESKMYNILNPPKHGEVGLCVPSNKKNGDAMYLLGVIVDDYSKVTDDMITVNVPEALYAVFTTPPVDTSIPSEENKFANVIKETWKYIFEEWFINSEYIFDESKLDFEFYDERCHSRKDSVMEIYVPVIKK